MTTEETTHAQVAAYVRRSDEYWRQAKEHWGRGQVEKASELAWGGVAERVKALALARTGKSFRGHAQIRRFVARLADDLGNRKLYQVFDRAEKLHENFYEGDLDTNDVRERLMEVEWLLSKLDSLLTGGVIP